MEFNEQHHHSDSYGRPGKEDFPIICVPAGRGRICFDSNRRPEPPRRPWGPPPPPGPWGPFPPGPWGPPPPPGPWGPPPSPRPWGPPPPRSR